MSIEVLESSEDLEEQELSEAEQEEKLLCEDEEEFFSFEPITRFYVWKEREEHREERIKLSGLLKALPCEEGEAPFIDAEGEYYPDYITENGYHLVSLPLMRYLQYKIDNFGQVMRNRVGIVAEKGQRVEEYCWIAPPEIDGILDGTLRFDRNGAVEYFEIDPSKVGNACIFRVKGFPYLIVTKKLNRIEFAGYECIRLENYFDFEGVRDRDYGERATGIRADNAGKAYEKQANALRNFDYVYSFRRVFRQEEIRGDIRDGLRDILLSLKRESLAVDGWNDRFLRFIWSKETGRVWLDEKYHEEFAKNAFAINGWEKVNAFVAGLPPDIKPYAEKFLTESLLYLWITECRTFERYEKIHGNHRFRLYLQEWKDPSVNPPMIYDYKSPFQREAEAANDPRSLDLNHKDLREFWFRSQILKNLKIEGSNLQKARFEGCDLIQAQFTQCDLTGARFNDGFLRQVVFQECTLRRCEFHRVDLRETLFNEGELEHAAFIACNMLGAKISRPDLERVYFYRTKLLDAVLEAPGIIRHIVFCLSDLRGAKIVGDTTHGRTMMEKCDFRSADLSGCQFTLRRISLGDFTKAKLTNADFSRCELLTTCKFRWCVFSGVNLGENEAHYCDFTFADLSKMRMMYGTLWSHNDFTYCNLTGYDFTYVGYIHPNQLIQTNLSGCNLEGAVFNYSELFFPDMSGANLKEAILSREQVDFVKLTESQASQIRVED